MGKTILTLVVLVLVVLAVVFRQREYLRDPLAKVYRNDVPQQDLQVFQNWDNDVLIQKPTEPGAYRILLQDWDQSPGTPVQLTCINGLVCLTSADHPPILPLVWTGTGKYDPKVTMTNHEVSFVNGDGALLRIELK